MKNLLCVLGGCLIGYLAKMKVDEAIRPWPFREWPREKRYTSEE